MHAFRFITHLILHRAAAFCSPGPDRFLPGFTAHVIRDSGKNADFDRIEELRSSLVMESTPLTSSRFGAGSRRQQVTIGDAIRISSAEPWKGRLLYRLAAWLRPSQVIELGTSGGISTLYLASGCKSAGVITVEGNSQLASLAKSNFRKLGLDHVNLINSGFDEALPRLTGMLVPGTLVYIDGNHTREATLRYFSAFSGKAGSNRVVVVDDINWSPGMRSAWQTIRRQTGTGVFLDLFFLGIYFANLHHPAQFLRVNYR